MAEELNNTEQEQVEVKSNILDDEQIEKIINEDDTKENEEDVVLPSEEETKESNEEVKEDGELEALKKEIEELKRAQKEGNKPNLTLLKELGEKALSTGLEDKDYSKLEALGYDRETVDIFIQGLKAKQEANTRNILEGVTTQEEYQEAIKYAGQNWNEQDIKEFNALLDSGNNTAIRFAIKGLIEEYRAKNSSNKETVKDIHKNTNPPTSGGVRGYETKADMMKDMSDPRYGKDIAYTKKVEQKIAQTDMSKWY